MTAIETAVISNRTAEDAAEDYLAAKKMLAECQKLVDEAAAELIAKLGVPEEGSKTHRIAGFKVELKGVINRKADMDLLDTISNEIAGQEAFFEAPIKIKRELDETALKKLMKEQPGIYARIAKAVTATPGKTGVSVSRTE